MVSNVFFDGICSLFPLKEKKGVEGQYIHCTHSDAILKYQPPSPLLKLNKTFFHSFVETVKTCLCTPGIRKSVL